MNLVDGDLVLVTGGNGFIGSILCAALQQRGLRVRILARHKHAGPWDECVVKDLADPDLDLSDLMQGVSVVFHLAARVHAVSARTVEDDLYQRINVQGTEQLVMAAASASVSAFVLFSSVKAMGEGEDIAATEDTPVAPVTAYGRSKLEAEQIVLDAGEHIPLVSILRLPLVYGPGMGGNLLRLLSVVRSGWMPSLSALPDNARSMIDVRDVAQAAYMVAVDPRAHRRVYLLTDGHQYSTQALVRMMRTVVNQTKIRWPLPWSCLRIVAFVGDGYRRYLGRRFVFDSVALRALTGSALYDGQRIQRELGFSPRWTFAKLMAEMATRTRAP